MKIVFFLVKTNGRYQFVVTKVAVTNYQIFTVTFTLKIVVMLSINQFVAMLCYQIVRYQFARRIILFEY